MDSLSLYQILYQKVPLAVQLTSGLPEDGGEFSDYQAFAIEGMCPATCVPVEDSFYQGDTFVLQQYTATWEIEGSYTYYWPTHWFIFTNDGNNTLITSGDLMEGAEISWRNNPNTNTFAVAGCMSIEEENALE